jgi:hypothetical protein
MSTGNLVTMTFDSTKWTLVPTTITHAMADDLFRTTWPVPSLAAAQALWDALLAAAPPAPTPTEASRSETGRGENVLRSALMELDRRIFHDAQVIERAGEWRGLIAAALAVSGTPLTARTVAEDALWVPSNRDGWVQKAARHHAKGENMGVLNEDLGAFMAALTARPVGEDALRDTLAWYGEQARLARLIHSEGDRGRYALADDGGKRAVAALANTTQPAAGQGAAFQAGLDEAAKVADRIAAIYVSDGRQEARGAEAAAKAIRALTPSTSKAADQGTGYVESHLDARQDRPDIPSNARVASTSKAAPLSGQGNGWRREKLDEVVSATVYANVREQLSRDECADLVRGLLADFDDMIAGRHEFADCYAPTPADDAKEGKPDV